MPQKDPISQSEDTNTRKFIRKPRLHLYDMNPRLYLDTRREKKDGTYPITITFSYNQRSAYVPTGFSTQKENWNASKGELISHPQKAIINASLRERLASMQEALLSLQINGLLKEIEKPYEVKKLALAYIKGEDPDLALLPSYKYDADENGFIPRFERFAKRHSNPKTASMYFQTRDKILSFDHNAMKLQFEDITIGWLRDFEAYLEQRRLKRSSRNIHFRNIRAVFNDAIDDEVTTSYPFRRFKLRAERTRKRSLSLEDLREIISLDLPQDMALHRDIFVLIFLLIGINMVDLAGLEEIENGRIYYRRAKTGRLYSVKVEPEARAIFKKYRGRKKLLAIFERNKDYNSYLSKCNKVLKKLGEVEIGKQGKRTFHPIHKGLSTYWARHTWATIASSIDIPKDTIAHALGHGENTVTDIYIDFDESKVDDANRRVIDWVFYGKK